MLSQSPDRRDLVPADLLKRLGIDATRAGSSDISADPALKATWISPRLVAALARLLEGFLVIALGTAIWLSYGVQPASAARFGYVAILLAAGLLLPLLLEISGLYTIHALLTPRRQLARLFACWSLVFAGLFAVLFFAPAGDDYSRLWAGSWYLAGLLVLPLARWGTALMVQRWNRDGRLARRAVLVGGGAPAGDLLDAMRSSQDCDVSVLGIFDDRDDRRSPPVVAGLRKLGTTAELIDFVRRTRIDLLIVTLPLSAETRLLEVLKRLWVLPVDIRLSAYTQKLRYRPRAYSYIGNVPFLDVFDKPLTEWGMLVKWLEDKVIASVALILLSPLMLLIAAAVKLDSRGPVFFRQKRYGFNNELIEVFKFRSMYADQSDATAAKLVTKEDPRVTRVGRLIRKTSLDELPQLINVLRGELSLVGPRPHATHAKAQNRLYTEVVEGYFARHKVKPGITGWAQINGWRGETDTMEKIQRRVEHDLYYVENWSLLFDLYILARTPFALLKAENAY